MSASAQKVGVVVIGLGIVGRCRVRDLKEETCGLRLKGIISRRPAEEEVRSYTFQEALADQDVQAIIISTEPALHEDYTRQALEHGKHVLVEYPLALTSAKAKELYSLAEEKGLILHEENIALLTETFAQIKEKAVATPLQSGTYTLKGKKNGWIEDFEKSGMPFVGGVAGLQVLMTHFGDLTATGATIDYHDDGYTTAANLQTASGSPISITLGRSPGMKRTKQEIYTFTDGEVLDTEKISPNTKGKRGLFAQDMHLFYDRITKDGKISESAKNLTIQSLQLAEKIHSYF